MPLTDKSGDIVPRDGMVACTQFRGTRDRAKRGGRFDPRDHWGDHHGRDRTW